MPQTTRPTEVLPNTWRGPDRDQSVARLIWTGVFVACPTLWASVAQGLFFGGSGCRAVAHTRPAFPKNAYGPVGIPLIKGRLRHRTINPTSPKGVKALGEGPLGLKEIPRHRDTLGQIRALTTRPAKCYPAPGEVQSEINLSPKWFGPGPLVLELLPYMVDRLAHYAEKVGDTQQYIYICMYVYIFFIYICIYSTLF